MRLQQHPGHLPETKPFAPIHKAIYITRIVSTINLVKYYVHKGMERIQPEVLHQYIALANQIAKNRQMYPKAVLIKEHSSHEGVFRCIYKIGRSFTVYRSPYPISGSSCSISSPGHTTLSGFPGSDRPLLVSSDLVST